MVDFGVGFIIIGLNIKWDNFYIGVLFSFLWFEIMFVEFDIFLFLVIFYFIEWFVNEDNIWGGVNVKYFYIVEIKWVLYNIVFVVVCVCCINLVDDVFNFGVVWEVKWVIGFNKSRFIFVYVFYKDGNVDFIC